MRNDLITGYPIEIPPGVAAQKAAVMLEMIDLPHGVRWFTCADGRRIMERRGSNPDEPIRGHCAVLVSESMTECDLAELGRQVTASLMEMA